MLKNEWLKNKVVVVTGASSGIGEEIAREAHGLGAKVVLIARNGEVLLQLSRELGRCCYAYPLDVTNEAEVEKTFARIYEEVGFIDVLVNNAGMGLFKTFQETSLKEVDTMFQVNVYGVIHCTQAVLSAMLEKGVGHIIQVGSMAGKIATPKSSIYAATKHALLGFSNALRMELEGTGIVVTVVNPGPVKTPFLKKADESGNYEKNAGNYMLTSKEVAKKVIGIMGKKEREVNIPRYFSVGTAVYSISPTLFEKLGKKKLNSK